MKIRRLEVTGYRSLRDVRWSPGDLNVVKGEAAGELAAAVFVLATTAGGWNEFADVINEDTEASWRNGVGETRWKLACHPEPDGRLDFTLELVIDREGGGRWAVGYERITRADDFEEHEILERDGDHVQYRLEPQAMRGRPKPPALPPQRSDLAGDITSLAALPKFRVDERVVQHADGMAGWMMYSQLRTDPGAPARKPQTVPGYQDILAPDGRNLVAALATACHADSGRKRLDRGMAAVVPDYEQITFPKSPDGSVGLELVAGGKATPLAELPDSTVAALLALAPLASTQPPAMLWFDEPMAGASESALQGFAAVAAEVSRWTQVVVATRSPTLLAALGAHGPTTVEVRTEPEGTTLHPVSA